MSSPSEPRDEHPFATTLIIAMLAMLGPFTIDSIYPAFTRIGDQFSVDAAGLQQLTSTYLLSFAVMSLFHGPISDAIGRKPVMITGVLVYAAASAGCALATSFEMMLGFRVLQGFAAGAGQIISRTLIRDLYSGVKAQKLMARVTMIFGVAPAIAPIMGGWILGFGSWRAIFWFLTVYGVAMAASVWLLLPETNPVNNRVPFNARSLLGGLVTVGRNPTFLRLAGASSFGFAAQFVYIGSAPIFVVDLLGKGERDFWMLFVPLVVGLVAGSWVSGRLAGRFSRRQIGSLAYGISVTACLVNVGVSALPGAPILPWAVLAVMVIAFGVTIAFPVLQLEMLDLFPRNRGAAASLQAFVMLVINAVLTGLIIPLVSGTALSLALTALGSVLIGLMFWIWHNRSIPADIEYTPLNAGAPA